MFISYQVYKSLNKLVKKLWSNSMKQEIKRKNSSINTITVEKLSIKKNRIKFSPNKNGFEKINI